ncbi:hypothetical protein TSOC_012910 [Tetrabaena socialis]|uniref:Uncharacterized protein n=1 Tax=Tetrabaena socialis TaxID=47790 RepID=A0A2J7ZLR6_9CHLO|nr:hypothetical protein TSOC_012910 [Tetrabaena socialis]|eukprot:PNH01213.1 hypothetical protein TSOC_012910 [Tetrabaena socialis]
MGGLVWHFIGFNRQALSNSTWALGKLSYRDQAWFAAAVGVAVVLVGVLVELPPQQGAVTKQGLTNSLWVLVVMGPGVLSCHQCPVAMLLREVV